MAKKKDSEEKINFEELDDKSKNKLINDAFAVLDSVNARASMLDNAQSNITDFEDTGCYILNALLSGNLKGGFPGGRMSVLAAPSSAGKSLIALQTAAYAQKKGKTVVIFDSENADSVEFAQNVGLDVSKVKYFPCFTIEECTFAIYKFLKFVSDNNMENKFFIVIDSLAAMSSELDTKRIEAENSASDMGTFAKSLKKLIKTCVSMAASSKTTIVATNHIYNDPSALYPGIEKKQPGGEAVIYFPSTIVQLSKNAVKEDNNYKIEDKATLGGADRSGIIITGLSIKNRICKPYVKANMYLSWENGFSKYYGLLDLALEFGILYNKAGFIYSYTNEEEAGITRDTRLGSSKELAFSEEFWEKYIPVLQRAIDEHWKYKMHNREETELS